MKKTNVIITSLAVAALCGTAAFAAPGKPAPVRGTVPPPPPQDKRAEKREPIFENAPEEIKTAHAEMKSLRRDLRLELCKDKPDSAKAMEMFTKIQELRTKVRGWEIQQILDGKAPKPEPFEHRGHRHGPDGFSGQPEKGRPGPGAPRGEMPKPQPGNNPPAPQPDPCVTAPNAPAPMPMWHPCCCMPMWRPMPGMAPCAPVPGPQMRGAQPGPDVPPMPQPEKAPKMGQPAPAQAPAPQPAPQMAGPMPLPQQPAPQAPAVNQ